jgi:hypothetical protein
MAREAMQDLNIRVLAYTGEHALRLFELRFIIPTRSIDRLSRRLCAKRFPW